jgi:hypothetical protein
MTLAWPLLLLLSPGTPASAATMGPAAQTLEALRGAAVDAPDRFFDGMDQRVTVLAPSSFVALPKDLEPAAADASFDSRVVAPGVTVHRPVPPEPRAPSRAEGFSGGTVLLVAGAALIAAAVLLLLFL